jgi:UPF0716 protein FxsA
MVKLLILLFIIVPALEVTLLVASSHWIGIWPTFLMIIAPGIIGAYLAKKQGIAVLREVQYRLSRGQMPTESLLDGGCILMGGILLLTPGYATDIIGFLLLFPITRKIVTYWFLKWIEKKIKKNNQTIIWK